jgi:hypothetical protein
MLDVNIQAHREHRDGRGDNHRFHRLTLIEWKEEEKTISRKGAKLARRRASTQQREASGKRG